MQVERPYREAARHYRARPPYSAELQPALAARLGWNGTGRLLDLGCGPGVLARQLAPSFAEIVGLDAEAAMLDEARAATPDAQRERFVWVEARAEDLDTLGLGRFTTAALGQSFHWMDRDVVAQQVRDALEPGGAIVLVHHARPATETARSRLRDTAPPVPQAAIWEVISRHLAIDKPSIDITEPYADLLRRHGFVDVAILLLPGRTDLIVDSEQVIDNVLSTSFAAPDRYGDALPRFRADMHALLAERSPDGRFLEWPGDTEVIVGLSR